MVHQVGRFELHGPNAWLPQPGVLLRLLSQTDYSKQLHAAIKDAAQAIQLVIVALQVELQSTPQGLLHTALFSTPQPEIGSALCAYVLEGLTARATGDSEWDADGPLFALQKARRRSAPPFALMQLLAEARRREIPVLRLSDGQILLGYGARGLLLHPQDFEQRSRIQVEGQLYVGAGASATPELHWSQLGLIPLLAISGEQGREACLQELARYYPDLAQIDATEFDACARSLADPGLQGALLSLRPELMANAGAPFERCSMAAILDLPTQLPAGMLDRAELARALAVPMLLCSHGISLLNMDDPALAGLAGYAPGKLLRLSIERDPGGEQRAFAAGDRLYYADQQQLLELGPAPQLPAAKLRGLLAARAFQQIVSNAGMRDERAT